MQPSTEGHKPIVVGLLISKRSSQPLAHAARINDVLSFMLAHEDRYPVNFRVLSVSDLTGNPISRFVKMLRKLSEMSAQSDLIHFTYFPPMFPLLSFFLRGRPFVVGPNITGSAFPNRFLGKSAIKARNIEMKHHLLRRVLSGKLITEYFAYKFSKKADQVITLSEYASSIVTYRGLDTSNMTFLPFAAPTSQAEHISNSGDQDPFTVAYVGRLDRRKGFDLFLELVKISDESISFLVIGDGILRDQLQELVQKKGNIRWLGKISRKELLGTYPAMDLYFQPSTYEAIATTVLEALRAGVPVLSSDIPSHLEISENTGIRYFKCGDVVSAAEQLSKIITSYQIIKQGAEDSSETLDVSHAADWLFGMYKARIFHSNNTTYTVGGING